MGLTSWDADTDKTNVDERDAVTIITAVITKILTMTDNTAVVIHVTRVETL
jgi:hypothetical protein